MHLNATAFCILLTVLSSKPMSADLIDTHNHIQVDRFDSDRDAIVSEAHNCGLSDAIICSGDISDFDNTIAVAHRYNWHYTLGIHPLFVANYPLNAAISSLNHAIDANLQDPLFAGIGEIGLDLFVKTPNINLQTSYFRAQLKLARKYHLSVSVHSRHAVDLVSKHLKELGPGKGVVHAFNGSIEQARRILSMGYKLGFGGSITFGGSKRIRRLLSELPADAFVLETDAPDMPSSQRISSPDSRTHIADIASYATIAAELRGCSRNLLCLQSKKNAYEAFPALMH